MKTLFFSIVLLLITLTVTGQAKYEIGVTATPNYTTVIPSGSHAHSLADNAGLGVGISVFRRINKYIYFNTGVNFTNRKYAGDTQIYNPQDQVFRGYIKTKWVDLEVPLNINVRVPVSERFSLTAMTGVTLGWNLKVESTHYSPVRDSFTYKSDYSLQKDPYRAYIGLGIGGIYNVNDRFSLMVVPGIMRDVKSHSTVSYDVKVSLLYKFLKK